MDQTSQDSQPKSNPVNKGSGKNVGMAALAYVIFFIPLLTEAKNDPFVKFHVKQGLVLFICSVLVWFVARVIPILGWAISPILNLFILVFIIIGIMNALNGTEKQLPFVGSFADNFKF